MNILHPSPNMLHRFRFWISQKMLHHFLTFFSLYLLPLIIIFPPMFYGSSILLLAFTGRTWVILTIVLAAIDRKIFKALQFKVYFLR